MDGEIRLVGGSVAGHEGTVQICRNEVWGTVCDDQWDNDDAKVVCRNLGYQAEGRGRWGTSIVCWGIKLILYPQEL